MTLPVVVVFPLFDRPVRAALKIGREAKGEQVQALAGIVHKHLLALAPIVDILKRAGWEVLIHETALVCRHPSVRTRAMAEVALCQLGVESQWFRVYDSAEVEPRGPTVTQNGAIPHPRPLPSPTDPGGPRNPLPPQP
ncbi:MAG TPA: hypothetical protein VKU02_18730 [Gemmataceae bacterium]|nr:hypothetical protein [Gemmataceae bacterium]